MPDEEAQVSSNASGDDKPDPPVSPVGSSDSAEPLPEKVAADRHAEWSLAYLKGEAKNETVRAEILAEQVITKGLLEAHRDGLKLVNAAIRAFKEAKVGA
ncbi:MAG: hypothetical protein WBG50_06015 [Desulfomonilaceae bacterium]